MRATRPVLFCSTAFTLTFLLAGCGTMVSSRSNSSTGTAGPSGPPPTVVATALQVNGVAPNRRQEVQFSEPMNPASINNKTIQMRDADGNMVQGIVSYDPDFQVASFDPSPALETNTKYTGIVTTGVQSASGAHLAANWRYSFTTRANTDQSPLGVLMVDPASGADCVNVQSKITITFTEEPDANTVTAANIAVTGPDGKAIPVKMELDVAATQVVLTPTSPLPNGQITVTVKNVADLADVAMVKPYTWSFSTACSSGGGTGSPTGEYVYVDADPASGSAGIHGWSVETNGSLTPAAGSPLSVSQAMDVATNGKYVFVAEANSDVTEYAIGAGGQLQQAQSINVLNYPSDGSEGPMGLSLDRTGESLYPSLSLNGSYEAFSIQ